MVNVIKTVVRAVAPRRMREAVYSWRHPEPVGKNANELSFWRSRHQIDEGHFTNSHYEQLMLAIAEEENQDFLKGKVVADFGCGPRGSLVWASSAALRIGIDVLADRYVDEFTDDFVSHDMVYLKCTEKVIPLPSESVDVMFTLNAIDHVDNFSRMCSEVVRVLKEGGVFIGSFNLEEPASSCEPQQLSEEKIKSALLNHLDVQSYRASLPGPPDNQYGPLLDGSYTYTKGEEGYLWVRAVKKSSK